MIPLDSMFAAIGHTLWAVSWQVCILAAIALIAERLFLNAPPSFRYLLWLLVLIRLAVPFDIPLHTPPGDFINRHIPIGFSPADSGITPSFPGVPLRTSAPIDPFPIAGMVWLFGFTSFLLYLAARFGKTRRLLSGAEPVTRPDLRDLLEKHASESGIRKKISLLSSHSESFHAPAVVGVIRPRIILPHEIVSTWPVEDIEPVLLHEIIHIKNRDLLVNWFQIILNGIYFFHPVVWLANSRIRTAREEICDDLSIARLHAERERYSLSMIRVGEEFLARPSFTIVEMGFMENGGSLGERIRRIMNGNYAPHRRLTAGVIIFLCAIAAFGIMLACERSAVRIEKARSGMTEARIEDLLNITVLNDSTFEVGGKRVSRADYARVVRERLPGYNYQYYLDGSPEVSVKALEDASHTAHGAGAGSYRPSPSVKKKFEEAGIPAKFLTVTIIDDQTFDVGGVQAGRSDLERVIREQFLKYGNIVDIRSKPKTMNEVMNSEVVTFVMNTVNKAGAKGIGRSMQPPPDFKDELRVGIIDETLFRFEGQHWVARTDLEREFRRRLPLYGNRVVILGWKETPEKLIRHVKDTARRAGAKGISYKVRDDDTTAASIAIIDDATFVVGNTRVARTDLERVLRERLTGQEYPVSISGYPDTSIETIQFVVDTSKRAGAKSIGWDPSLNQQMFEIMKKTGRQPSGSVDRSPVQSSRGNIISLGRNVEILKDSLKVILNEKVLAPGIDYTVDFKKGEITILNKDAMNPSSKLEIRYIVNTPEKLIKTENGYIKPPTEELISMTPRRWNPDTKSFEIPAQEMKKSAVEHSERLISRARNGQDSNFVHIVVRPDGSYEVNGNPVGKDDLERTIREKLPERENTVEIYKSAEAPRQSKEYLDTIIRSVKPRVFTNVVFYSQEAFEK